MSDDHIKLWNINILSTTRFNVNTCFSYLKPKGTNIFQCLKIINNEQNIFRRLNKRRIYLKIFETLQII